MIKPEEMENEEYAFAYNINGTGMSGIITMTNPPKLVCYCDEENSKTILKALNPSLPPAEGAEAIKQALCDDIKKSLNGAYLDKIFDSEQNSLPLVDYLSAAIPGNTIASGKKEIENIVEQIYFDMEEWQSLALLQQQPTAEGAAKILASLIESLGEPDNSIHDHSYEIRPLTVNGKCEWWMFHNGVGSGEPLAQWLQNFATLHAQRIADKMVGEKCKKCKYRGLPDSINEALNSGDGVYRP